MEHVDGSGRVNYHFLHYTFLILNYHFLHYEPLATVNFIIFVHLLSGRVGSGRVGSGRVGSGRVGSGKIQISKLHTISYCNFHHLHSDSLPCPSLWIAFESWLLTCSYSVMKGDS
jgi:hypothetical protein